MRDSQTRWYHHLRYPRVLFTIIFTVVIYLIFAAAGIYVMFWR